MQRKTIYFTAPKQIELRREPLPFPGPDEVLVETLCSAISAGTEMLVYHGRLPKEVDAIDSISSGLHYPTSYGYANVGRVRETGKRIGGDWENRLVFSFQPHTSHFIATPKALIPIPDALSPQAACFLPNMETAVNLVQDAAPILGERVLVLGQGVIGLLTAALLKEFPLETLVTADHYPIRRAASLALGVSAALDPTGADFCEKALSHCHAPLIPHRTERELPRRGGFDLTLELSGNPSALNDALAVTAFSGRIVIGSWYGDKRLPIDLGSVFHHSRIKLISSQVSTIAPELSARWSKERRFQAAWDALQRIQPDRWITQSYSIEDAQGAYQLLDESPQEAIQIVFNYT
ncbi:MAG TPA: zinc-binding alcohol dehydrogenase [Anaerolineales bacterium]|nr:zinc-binding alcohol dehydrogenase [Anaerolineales bacterium]